METDTINKKLNQSIDKLRDIIIQIDNLTDEEKKYLDNLNSKTIEIKNKVKMLEEEKKDLIIQIKYLKYKKKYLKFKNTIING